MCCITKSAYSTKPYSLLNQPAVGILPAHMIKLLRTATNPAHFFMLDALKMQARPGPGYRYTKQRPPTHAIRQAARTNQPNDLHGDPGCSFEGMSQRQVSYSTDGCG